jgi:peptidoglycan/LPS O-acetylase OafA/YrhL
MDTLREASRKLSEDLHSDIRSRLHLLDGLRFVAAAAVLSTHYFNTNPLSGVIPSPDFAAIGQVARYGFLGVHVFFVISGFVILATAYKAGAVEFVSGRFARIVPTFAICALITLTVTSIDGRQAFSPWLYLANLTFEPHIFGLTYIDGAYWTLRYEVQFYAYTALVLTFFDIRKVIMPICICWLAIAAICTAGLMPKLLRWIFIADYAPLFIVGIGIFLWLRERKLSQLVLIGAATSLSVVNELAHSASQPIHVPVDGPYWNPWIIGIFVACIPLIVIGAATPLKMKGKMLYILGGLSYPIYLLHSEIGISVSGLFPANEPIVAALFATLFVAAIAAVVFVVDDRYRSSVRLSVERLLRRRFTQRERAEIVARKD